MLGSGRVLLVYPLTVFYVHQKRGEPWSYETLSVCYEKGRVSTAKLCYEVEYTVTNGTP